MIQIFLHLSKCFLPHYYSALTRYQDDIDLLFDELLSLGSGDHEVLKFRHSLMKLKRKQNKSLSLVLLVSGSLCQALYNLTRPELKQQYISKLIVKLKLFLLGAFVSKRTMEILVQYSHERASKCHELNLIEIVGFVKDRECSSRVPTPGGNNDAE